MLYSLVIPIYNDGALAEAFCLDYEIVFKNYLGKENIETDTELIFVNDGSKDNSLEYLVNLVCHENKIYCCLTPQARIVKWRCTGPPYVLRGGGGKVSRCG